MQHGYRALIALGQPNKQKNICIKLFKDDTSATMTKIHQHCGLSWAYNNTEAKPFVNISEFPTGVWLLDVHLNRI
jgi:hypothetical protein